MSRYSIIQSPLQSEKIQSPKHHSNHKNNSAYHLELIKMLQKSRKINERKPKSLSNKQHYQIRNYQSPKPQHIIILPNQDDADHNLNQTRVYLPKIKRKSKVVNAITYDIIDKDKQALRNFMNAKLIFHKNTKKDQLNGKKSKRTKTLDHSIDIKQFKKSPKSYTFKIIKTPTHLPHKYLIKQSNPNGQHEIKQYQQPQRLNVQKQRQIHRKKRRSQSNPQFSTGTQSGYKKILKKDRQRNQYQSSQENDDSRVQDYPQYQQNLNTERQKKLYHPHIQQNLNKYKKRVSYDPQNLNDYKKGTAYYPQKSQNSTYKQKKQYLNKSGEYPSKKKSLNNQQKAKKQEQQLIDPLNLETYFIQIKKNQSKQQSHGENNAQRIKFKIPAIPKKEQMSKFIRNYVPEFQQIKIEDLIKSKNFQVIEDLGNNNQHSFYFGEVSGDKKHGKGILITPKSFFEGIWAQDERVLGVEQTESGKYKGEFKDGQRSGNGQFFWSHGQYYSGQWKNGKKTGSGYWRSPKGESYMGEWRNGQVTGNGVHIMNEGQRYQGQFVNFLKHGFGYEQFPNGDRYQGRYVQGQAHGKGKYFWKNATVYSGDFINGYREGKGHIIAPNKLQFKGRFKKDIITGNGYLRMRNGDIFNGMFQDNKMNGDGVFELKSQKKVIRGIWENNKLVRLHQ